MRTTVTLEPDVAIQLERVRRARNVGFKEVLNDALRRGLVQMETPSQVREPYRTRVWHSGGLLIDPSRLEHMNAFVGDLDVEHFLQVSAEGRKKRR